MLTDYKAIPLLPCPCGAKATWFKNGRSIGIECSLGGECRFNAQTDTYQPELAADCAGRWNFRDDEAGYAAGAAAQREADAKICDDLCIDSGDPLIQSKVRAVRIAAAAIRAAAPTRGDKE